MTEGRAALAAKGRVFVCAIGANYSSQPYINKLVGVINDLGTKPTYLYWQRSKCESVSRDGRVLSKLVLSFESSTAGSLLVGYLLWVFRLFVFAAFHARAGDVIFASRVDCGLPIYCASFFRKFRYVYLDRDAAFLSYRAPAIVVGMLKWIETRVGRGAVLHLVPGRSRDHTGASNVRIVPNSPSSRELDGAKALVAGAARDDEKFTVYINGWLKSTRGIGFALNAIRCVSPLDFRIIVAGELGCDEARSLIEAEGVTYLGVLNNAEALSWYYLSDVVLSFYDPAIAINRAAEPNKWYDCVCTRTRFITNRGIDTAEVFVKMGVCDQVSYGDSEELVRLLEKLRVRKQDGDWSWPASVEEHLPKPWDVTMAGLLVDVIQ